MFNHLVFSVLFFSSFFFLALLNSLTDFSDGRSPCLWKRWNWMFFKVPKNSGILGYTDIRETWNGKQTFPNWDLCPSPLCMEQ